MASELDALIETTEEELADWTEKYNRVLEQAREDDVYTTHLSYVSGYWHCLRVMLQRLKRLGEANE